MVTEGIDLEVPKPSGIAALPMDGRGVPIAVHVPRRPGIPVRIADVDPDRLLALSGNRRCALCGWAIPDDDLCWYVSDPESIEKLRASGWKLWDSSLEGVAHEDCLVYAAIVCPFLSRPDYVRRSAQRAVDGSVVYDKGFVRPEILLAGAPDVVVQLQPNRDQPFRILVGGGEPMTHHFRDGSELAPVLDALLSSPREPNGDDLVIAQLMAEADMEPILLMARQVTAEAAGRSGFRQPPGGRNDLCFCGTGLKFKNCCLPRYEVGRAQRRGT